MRLVGLIRFYSESEKIVQGIVPARDDVVDRVTATGEIARCAEMSDPKKWL